MSIEKNSFSGTIPYSFRYMNSLSSLSLQVNDITGTMPWKLCPEYSSNIEELKADCDEISCDCCTECFINSKERNPQQNNATTVVASVARAGVGGGVRRLLRRTK